MKVGNRLPKPRSGKIVRRTIEQIADGVKCDTPATIEDSEVLEEIKALLVAGASHRQ